MFAKIRAEVITNSFMLVVTGRRRKPEVHNFTVTAPRGEMLVTARERAGEVSDAIISWTQRPTHCNVSVGKGEDGRRHQLIQLG